jgi:hypothetical protein
VVGRYEKAGIPPVFVVQRNTVVTKDQEALAPPTAIGYRGERPGLFCYLKNRCLESLKHAGETSWAT